jgi:hypothetical protein
MARPRPEDAPVTRAVRDWRDLGVWAEVIGEEVFPLDAMVRLAKEGYAGLVEMVIQAVATARARARLPESSINGH